MVKKGDTVFSDELNHASIIDGCRLSKAKIVTYAHNDMDDLRKKIQRIHVRQALLSVMQFFLWMEIY